MAEANPTGMVAKDLRKAGLFFFRTTSTSYRGVPAESSKANAKAVTARAWDARMRNACAK